MEGGRRKGGLSRGGTTGPSSRGAAETLPSGVSRQAWERTAGRAPSKLTPNSGVLTTLTAWLRKGSARDGNAYGRSWRRLGRIADAKNLTRIRDLYLSLYSAPPHNAGGENAVCVVCCGSVRRRCGARSSVPLELQRQVRTRGVSRPSTGELTATTFCRAASGVQRRAHVDAAELSALVAEAAAGLGKTGTVNLFTFDDVSGGPSSALIAR